MIVAPSLEIVTLPYTHISQLHEYMGTWQGTDSNYHLNRILSSQHHLAVVDQFVHPPGPECGPHCIGYGHARIDIADQLRRALRCICPLLKKDDLGLLRSQGTHEKVL